MKPLVHRQRLIRYIAAVPGTDLDAEAAASLLWTAPDTARSAVAELVGRANFLADNDNRLRPHDLVRAYALDLITELIHGHLTSPAAELAAALRP